MSVLNKLFLLPRRFSDFEMYLLLLKIAKKSPSVSYQVVANISKWKVAEIKTFAEVNAVNFLSFTNDTSIMLWYRKDEESFIVKYNIPERYRVQEFIEAYMEYAKARKGLTASVAQHQFNKLDKYPMDICIQAVKNSTSNGWTGLFPEKTNIIKTTTHNARIKSESEW
jgi:hypothetical protein